MQYTVRVRSIIDTEHTVDLDFPLGETKPEVMDQMVRKAAKDDLALLLKNGGVGAEIHEARICSGVWRDGEKVYPRREWRQAKGSSELHAGRR